MFIFSLRVKYLPHGNPEARVRTLTEERRKSWKDERKGRDRAGKEESEVGRTGEEEKMEERKRRRGKKKGQERERDGTPGLPSSRSLLSSHRLPLATDIMKHLG